MENKKKFYKTQKAPNTKVTCKEIAALPEQYRAEAMKVFIGMHVKAALKAAATKHYQIRTSPIQFKELLGFHSLTRNLEIEEKIILLAYPLTNIQ